ncbi:MAG: hypothetical protein JO318_18280 [Chloroflexi bacterium]|nr:hypothetical protein [Chloroflexota bacterium]
MHVKIQDGDERELVEAWHRYVEQPMQAARRPVPSLTILDSPYRMLYERILNFVCEHTEQQPDRIVTLVVPEMVEPPWYEFLLHNLNGERLRALLLLRVTTRRS